jgi:hypothetical protein
MARDLAAIMLANLASFGVGMLFQYCGVWPFTAS